jgi:hypothetical protein
LHSSRASKSVFPSASNSHVWLFPSLSLPINQTRSYLNFSLVLDGGKRSLSRWSFIAAKRSALACMDIHCSLGRGCEVTLAGRTKSKVIDSPRGILPVAEKTFSVDNWKDSGTLPCREPPVPDDALGIADNPSPASIAGTYVMYARRSYVHNKPKCKLPVCTCSARANDLYCSDYCRQAFSQGTERDFCQCAHSDCSEPVHTGEIIDATGLPGSISFAPGWVTIEYSDQQDLRDQLILLMTRVDIEIGTEAHPPRLAPSRAPSMKALRSA